MATLQEDVARAQAMLAQTKAEGSKPFAGSSYDKNASSLKGTMTEPKTAPNNMQAFSAALNKAVSLARGQRNDASLDLVGKFVKPGSVSASSFTSLLSDINTASDSFTEPLVSDALDVAKSESDERSSIRDLALKLAQEGVKKEVLEGILAAPNLDAAIAMAGGSLNSLTKDAEIRSVGRQLVRINPETGQAEVIFTGLDSGGGGSDAGTGFFKSGALKIDNADIGEGAQTLASSRGEDGFVNSQLYSDMYQHWTENGGLPQDFFKNYDPDMYLNPMDPSVPTYIKSQMAKPKGSDLQSRIDALSM